MPRATWSRLVPLLLALPLASCFDADTTCPTCPPENSARIVVQVPANGEVDSIHVVLDGGPRATVRRGTARSFEGLSRGVHSLALVRWYEDFGLITTRSTTMRVVLDQGETRVLIFHGDFPLMARGHSPGRDPAALAHRPAPHRVG